MTKRSAPPPWIDLDTLYTRQDIVALTDIDDEVLGYWIKRGLLKHSEGGDGKGVHRRYSYEQINIAVILAVFRDRFGANISTLGSLALLLQRSVQLFANTRVDPSDWWKVGNLGRSLSKFRRGEEVLIAAHHWSDPDFESVPPEEYGLRKPAANEAEIIARELDEAESSLTAALKLADHLGENADTVAAAAESILGIMINPRRFSDTQWLIRQTGEQWAIFKGNDDAFTDAAFTEPALFLPVTLLLRKAWNIPPGGVLMARDVLKKFNLALRDAGLGATVRYDVDSRRTGRGFIIEPQSAAGEAQLIGAKLGLGRHHDMDQDFARRYDHVYWTPSEDADEVAG